MAEFIVRLGTPAGEIVTRTVEALAAHEARARLEREGFKVFAVTPPKAEGVTLLTRGGGAGGRSRVKANDFLLFNQQLAALLRAGIPILQAITMLRRRATSPRLRAVLEEVEEAIRGGAALSQAFAAQGATFPRIYTASILAGERSGALDEVLSRYVTYMRRSVGLRRKIRGALVHVNSQNAGEKILVNALAVVERIVLVAFVAERNVEIAVRAKMQIAAVVIAGFVNLREERKFGVRQRNVCVRGRRLKPCDPFITTARSRCVGEVVKNIKITVRRVTRMKGQPKQTFLASETHAARNVHEDRARRRGQICDDCDAAAALDDE